MSDLQDAINAMTFGDPVKAIEAFNRGAEAARAAGFDDTPLEPEDGEYDVPGMGRVRVIFTERPDDTG